MQYKASNVHDFSPSPRGIVAEVASEAARPAVDELRAELVAHLRDTHLSFLTDCGRQFLAIPGHHPIAFAPIPAHHTGTHFYEETTTLVLNYLLRNTDPERFFDVGAAGGYFSRVAASLKLDPPQVDAFEMRPSEVERMHGMLEDDEFADRIALHQVAVSDEDADGALVWMARSLLFEERPARDEYEEAWWRRLKFWLRNDRTRGLSAISTDLTSIDGFVKRSGRSPDIMKMDVEGYEGRVLLGARDTLRKSRPYILLELHADTKQRFGMRRQEIAQTIFDAGYDALYFTDHQNKSRCEILPLGPRDALLSRQKTTLVLFVPR